MYNVLDVAMTEASQIREMLIPNNADTLVSLVNKSKSLFNTSSFSESTNAQEQQRLGAKVIGIFATATTAQYFFQMFKNVGLLKTNNMTVKFNGKDHNVLGQEKSI